MQFVELPAGMVDDGTFKGSAAKEIKEEIGLEIPEDELVSLTDLAIPEKLVAGGVEETLGRGVFPSVGGCDEYIPLFLYEKRVPRGTLKEWEGRLTGLRDEGEKISLKLVRVEEMWKVAGRDAKALCALSLWEGLKKEGKL
jgi:8-oxo-dGTP pyrophosphatase MutT (NUDIX family)